MSPATASARADVVIEAIFENVEAKRSLFAAVEAQSEAGRDPRDQHVVHSARGHRDGDGDPTRLIGLHFFNPVAEDDAGRDRRRHGQTRAELTAPGGGVRPPDRQLPLPVKSAPGFLVNRVLAPYLMAAMRCVDEGIAPETVDEAALAFGMPMGPIELADTVGLDICVAVGKMLAPDADAAEEAGRARRGGTPRPQDQARLLRLRERQAGERIGARRRTRGTRRPPHRPFVAEASAALAEGIVADADLVDAGAIFGTGFAPFRGGPLHYARAQRLRPGRAPAQCRRLLV